MTYSIAGGNAAGRFEIDAASGELFYVGGGEDYETGSTRFELTVRASDGDQTTDTSVTVNVTDVAEAPTFAQAGYTFDLAEETDGSANRLSLGTVSATDPDGGSVTYSIEGGNAAGLFEIDAASGELFYVGGGRGLRDRFHPLRADRPGERRGSDDRHQRDRQRHGRGRAGGSRSAGYGSRIRARRRRYPSLPARTSPGIRRRAGGLRSATRRRAGSGAMATATGLPSSWWRGGPTSSICGAVPRATAR